MPSNSIEDLKAENARLIALLETRGIEWRARRGESAVEHPPDERSPISPDQKVALFRRLFRGRTDVYALRWENKAGKSGYAPACSNEWKPGVCEKPRIKCADCLHRRLVPLTDHTIREHLIGRITVGIYPLLQDDTCHFLAADFDESDWREDAQAFLHSCRELAVPVLLEISRSGNGAHAWIPFSTAIPARDARHLGAAIISHTCSRTRQLRLTSYDRLFPSQDSMPKGGFGNLIALPLQKERRDRGFTVFVDEWLQPVPDQWNHLATLRPLTAGGIESAISRCAGKGHPLDVPLVDVGEGEQEVPWRRSTVHTAEIPGPLPAAVTATLAGQLFFEKAQLPQPLANRLIRLAAFQNPEFHRAQAMRLSVWNKPRVIGCAENYPKHIALPRGCLDAARDLLQRNRIELHVRDERCLGEPLDAAFTGTLRADQKKALDAVARHDMGVLRAPTAFGKTVVGASLIARRAVNTLIIVHRAELMMQWRERLGTFLRLDPKRIGTIGAGRAKPTGIVDIALMQSLSKRREIDERVERYGQVIVDECHHVSAASLEAILRRVKARYVLGLTATPARRDGHEPIVFMQCGPIRHTAGQPNGAPQILDVVPCFVDQPIDVSSDARIQDLFRHLADDPSRTRVLREQVVRAFREGRKVLVLTERTEHLDRVHAALGTTENTFLLHGKLSKKERNAVLARIGALPPDAARIILATGKLVGEGFDHPPLDTLVLAMPVSWKGTLQQYAGRLHREHASKRDVRIIDIVDTGHAVLLRMWSKRQRGYRAMGYVVRDIGAGGMLLRGE